MSCNHEGRFVYQKRVEFLIGTRNPENNLIRKSIYMINVSPATETVPSMVTVQKYDNGPVNETEDDGSFDAKQNGVYLYKLDFSQTDMIEYAVKVLVELLKEDKLPENYIQKLM